VKGKSGNSAVKFEPSGEARILSYELKQDETLNVSWTKK
jgi:hypothetical protein